MSGTLQRLRSIPRGVLRRLVMAPFRLIDDRTRAEALERLFAGMVSVTSIPGGSLRFFAPTPLLQERAAMVLTKEPDMLRWIDAMEAGSVLWDIGANVGVFSLYAAARGNATVLAFEPSAANYFALTRNIQLNDFSRRVTAYCFAFAGATGLGMLNLPSDAMGMAMSQFGKAGETNRYWSGTRQDAFHGMLGITLDDFVDRFAPPFPTHIKMDVDGLEPEILQGATRTLRDPRMRAAMIELSITDPEERARAMSLLASLGLKFVSQGELQGTMEQSAANHLFERVRS